MTEDETVGRHHRLNGHEIKHINITDFKGMMSLNLVRSKLVNLNSYINIIIEKLLLLFSSVTVL